MASLRAYLFKKVVRTIRNTIIHKVDDVLFVRKAMAYSSRRLKVMPEVHFRRFYIDEIPSAWFLPKKVHHQNAILYLHGGGYAVGSIYTHKSLISKLVATSNTPTLAIDYRLAPENPYPAAIDDALKAYQFLLTKGYLPQQICIAGDSAGGGLTLATLLKIKELGIEMPGCAVCLSPWTDLTISGASVVNRKVQDPMLPADRLMRYASQYAGAEPTNSPFISPLFGNLKNLPPLLIQVGTDEVLLDDSLRFAEKAKLDGVKTTLEVWEDMIHVWQYFWQYIPEGEKAIKNIALFIQKNTNLQALGAR